MWGVAFSSERPSLLRTLWRAVAPIALRESIYAARRSFHKHFYERSFGYDGLITHNGPFQRDRLSSYFQYREKAECTMAAASSWYGGDYMEFGSAGLHTFRNMLTACDLFGLDSLHPGTRFYAFDAFGAMESDSSAVQRDMAAFDARTGYFRDQFPQGDALAEHQALLRGYGSLVERCHFVQGFFHDTLTKERAASYLAEGRQIGFAFIDCNFEEFYKVVLEFIFDLMAVHSYVYLDEYFQCAGATLYFDEFSAELRKRRNIGCVMVRSAAGFGALFRLYPLVDHPPLDL